MTLQALVLGQLLRCAAHHGSFASTRPAPVLPASTVHDAPTSGDGAVLLWGRVLLIGLLLRAVQPDDDFAVASHVREAARARCAAEPDVPACVARERCGRQDVDL